MSGADKATVRWLLALLALEFLYIFLFLLNYDMAWMHHENPERHVWALSNGSALHLEDLGKALNTKLLEYDDNRISRPLSDILLIINAKFRAFCWNFVPPHPSLSMLWPLSFICLPVFLFKFLRNMGCPAAPALAGVCLYLASPGFLSSVVMLFHPAKGLVNVLAVLSLFFASQIYARLASLGPRCSVREVPRFWPYFTASLSCMFVAFFSDETGVFIYVMAAFFLYPVVFRFRERWLLLGCVLLLPLAYFGVMHFVLPYLHFLVKGRAIDLARCSFFPKTYLFFWKYFWINFAWLAADHPHLQLNVAYLWPNNKPLFALQAVYTAAMLGVLGASIRAFWQAPQERLKPALLYSTLLVMFVFFHTLQFTKFSYTWGVWWYGELYSLIYFILFTFILRCILEGKDGALLRRFFVPVVCLAVVHGMVFSTYRVDVFEDKRGHPPYTKEQVFTGRIGEYYRNFSFTDSVRKSACRRIYTFLMWAKAKNKDASAVTQPQIDRCRAELADDISFPKEIEYARVEL